jgi:hypothetical protein
MAWPELRDGQWMREPTDQEIDALLELPEKIEQIRARLSSLSWFMARWKEPIARLCNAEMERSGHFWESRFGSRELLDEAAVLTCSIYVDLNQLRAGMAETLEDSRHAAIWNRIVAAKRREAEASREAFAGQDSAAQYAFSQREAEALFEDCWLAPITADGPLLTADALPVAVPAESPSPEAPAPSCEDAVAAEGAEADTGPEVAHDPNTSGTSLSSTAGSAEAERSLPSRRHRLTRRRASDAAILDIPWPEYLRVLQAVAAVTLAGQDELVAAGASGETLQDVLTRWGLNAPVWLAEFQQLDHRCTRVLGAAHRVLARAGEVAQRWFHGIGWCREIFVGSPSDAFT